jgi:Right handed beta helix region
VSPRGSSNFDGSSFSAAMDIKTALSAVKAGELLLLEPGTYTVPYTSGVANTIKLSKSGTASARISMVAANCGRAIFDFSFPEQAWVQDSYGFDLTGSYWYFRGIEITRAGYQGVYVTGKYNTFENCAFHHNRNTGLEINKGGAYTTVINSDAYRNYDPKKLGSMADGFGPKQTQGPGNKFIGCRAWENSDDGFDMFDSPEQVIVENSWAFRNGVDVWNYGGFAGNGNGFKLGGNKVVANNRIINSVAFDNPQKGFDQNNNAGGITILNCTAYSNGINFGLGNPVSSGQKHYLRNNISLSGSVSVSNADAKFNSWDTAPAAIVSDFQNVNLSLATAARNADGSLPDNGLFRLNTSSKLINAGTSVGLPYLGTAPDLGAFEKQ